MSYLGSTPTTQSFIAGTDYFNGTGSAVNFTLSRSVNSVNDIEVVVNNVEQSPAGYTVSGTTLTFSAAPSSGTSNVYVRYLSTTLQSITIPAGTAVNGSFTATTLLDGIGNVRSIPQNAQTSAYVLTAADNGKHISITTGGVTVPASVFSVGQVVVIFNNSGSSQTITQGVGVTMYSSSDGTTGNRTLALRGMATVLCVATNVFAITGAGLT